MFHPKLQGLLSRHLRLDELLEHGTVQARGAPGATDLVSIQGPPEASSRSSRPLTAHGDL